jgi:polyisoprenoid-binding protein YceI
MTRYFGLLIACFAIAADAAPLGKLDPARSQIGFGYVQMGVKLEGAFKSLSGQVSFDPAQLDKSKAALEIKMASVDTGLDEANDAVKGKDWFNASAFPTARFDSTSVQALGGNRFQVAGKLTIKGRTRNVSAPFTLQSDAAGVWFAGAFNIRRADFAIGEGEWSDFDVVGNDIAIRFKLRVNR